MECICSEDEKMSVKVNMNMISLVNVQIGLCRCMCHNSEAVTLVHGVGSELIAQFIVRSTLPL